jgi:hypothetical protein
MAKQNPERTSVATHFIAFGGSGARFVWSFARYCERQGLAFEPQTTMGFPNFTTQFKVNGTTQQLADAIAWIDKHFPRLQAGKVIYIQERQGEGPTLAA